MASKNIYNLEDYADFSKANAAEQKKNNAESAVNNFGDFSYGRQGAYDRAIDAVVNWKPFQYDLNSDALYDQYKNQYQALGKLAMQDTMGQAAALTGGYGNSYAATVGNQAYQSYLSQLNDVIPQLYQMALSRYNSERDAANGALGALSADRSTQYGEWNDRLNRSLTDRSYYGNEYDNAYNLALQLARNAISDEQDQRNFDYQKELDQRNFAYQQERDQIADEQWQKNYNLSLASKSSSGGSGGSSGSSGSKSNSGSSSAKSSTAKKSKADVLSGIMVFKDVDTLEDYLLPYVENGSITKGDMQEAVDLFIEKRGAGSGTSAEKMLFSASNDLTRNLWRVN